MDADEPVFVIDLRDETLRDGRASLGEPGDEPLEADGLVARVAVVDENGDVSLHAIAPTRDRRFLDALGRLIRFAHARGESVRAVAERYGTEYERRLLFEGRLPHWVMRYPARG